MADIAASDRRPIVITIDVPIGLLDSGARACDREARVRLGAARSSSVFDAPIRPTLSARNHAEASAARRSAEGKGMSIQAWCIVPKVREVDLALRADARLRSLVREVHPEVCLAQMNQGQPMAHNKKKVAGREERVVLLRAHFGETIDQALASKPSGCARDDLLDAFAAAWTAARVARATAFTIPANPPLDQFGLPMQMVV